MNIFIKKTLPSARWTLSSFNNIIVCFPSILFSGSKVVTTCFDWRWHSTFSLRWIFPPRLLMTKWWPIRLFIRDNAYHYNTVSANFTQNTVLCFIECKNVLLWIIPFGLIFCLVHMAHTEPQSLILQMCIPSTFVILSNSSLLFLKERDRMEMTGLCWAEWSGKVLRNTMLLYT